jgi:hypothetical protein
MPRYGFGLALALALTACTTGGGAGTRPGPSATLPPATHDERTIETALVTAADLGPPWVDRDTVHQVGTNELCPGQQNAAARAPARASAKRRMTEGTKPTAAIAWFAVRAYTPADTDTWRDAFIAAARACPSWRSAEGAYVELTLVPPPAVVGADETLAHLERGYADQTKKTLQYVRHYYEARSGRVVSALELAYVPPRSDPRGVDMTTSAALLEEQVAKVRGAFRI